MKDFLYGLVSMEREDLSFSTKIIRIGGFIKRKSGEGMVGGGRLNFIFPYHIPV